MHIAMPVEDIMAWKRIFPDGSLRDDVEAPIKAVIACRSLASRIETPIYDTILERLDTISKTSDPAARVPAVNDLWRKTRQFVIENVPALEAHTSLLHAASSSAVKRRRVAGELKRYHGTLRRVHKFFVAYSAVTGEAFEWESIWTRLSGQSTDVPRRLKPSLLEQEIDTGMSGSYLPVSSETCSQVDATPQALPAWTSKPPRHTIGTSLADVACHVICSDS
jgi:hypothetical protein